MDLFSCNWDTAKFLIFSQNVFDPLIYYSHLLPMISSLILGTFVYLNNPHQKVNRLLLFLTVGFSLWVYFDLILWASEKSELIMFFWSSMIYVEYAIFVIGFWLLYTFLFQSKLPTFFKTTFIALSIPLFLLANTEYSLIAYSLANCDREPFEGALWTYLYIVELVVCVMAIFVSIKYFLQKNADKKNIQKLFFSVGTVIFMALFFMGNVALIYLGSRYEQYKLFGMLFFLLILIFIIVRFKTFNAKLMGAQALVWILMILICSQFFFAKTQLSRILTSVTLVSVMVAGYYLVRSVKQIDIQREQLERANVNQQSLLHFITHQVKAYMTKSRNIFDGMIAGDYGDLNPKVAEMAKYGFESETRGVETVQAILKASDLKTGRTQLKKEKINLSSIVADVIDYRMEMAKQKNLDLTFDVEPNMEVMADPLQIREVFKNLVTNAIVYTPKGQVHVVLKDDEKGIKFSVIDTGFGLSSDDKQKLFTEGGKGTESLSINIDSSGYGLFIAKQIVSQHGGKIGAVSEGRNKGSEFFVILPHLK